MRYLRRVMQWGRNRGFLKDNPAKGIESPKERKQRRLPDDKVMVNLTRFAQQQGQLKSGQPGACSPYLWYVMEIGYLCRLRGIETITLTDENELAEGVLTTAGRVAGTISFAGRLGYALHGMQPRPSGRRIGSENVCRYQSPQTSVS